MIVRKHIVYPGIEKPSSILELKVEMSGLKNAIKVAEELISRYEQAIAIMELKQEEMSNASQEKSTFETQECEGREGEEKEGDEGAKGGSFEEGTEE